MKKNSNFWVNIFLCLCFFALGVLSEKLIFHKYFVNRENQKNDSIAASSSNIRKFTNPLLDCKPNFSYISPKIESVIVDKVSSFKRNKAIGLVSVYFRDLNNGTCYGVNEKENFAPESLNKVPLMIAALKLSEQSPEILKLKFSLDEKSGTFKKVDSTEVKDKSEKLYNLYDVVENMIKSPQGETTRFLTDLMNSTSMNFSENVFIDFGLKQLSPKEQHPITTKDCAAFLSVLYNSTYINSKNSEKALSILAGTEFKDGLLKGIGKDSIMVAHKYGQTGDKKLFQLHDCGIIYYPKSNYILCVMVKGTDIEQMKTAIQSVSKAVFEEMKTQVPTAL